MIGFERIQGFDSDAGNARKNERHGVTRPEGEQAFFGPRRLVAPVAAHLSREPRLHALGATLAGRLLHVTFTLRSNGTRIRVISARDMSRRESSI